MVSESDSRSSLNKAPGAMQLKANLTRRDYTKFRRFSLFRLRKIWLMLIPFVVIYTWTGFPNNYAELGMTFVVALTITFLMAVAFIGFVCLLGLVLTPILPNRPTAVLGEHTFTITDSEFQEINATGSVSLKLDALRRCETSQHIFLLGPSHVGHILPMRDLQNNPEFLRTLRERIKHN